MKRLKSSEAEENMVERERRRRNFLQTLNDRDLMKRYRLDGVEIMFAVDLIQDVLTSPTQCNNVITPEMKVIVTLRYLKLEKCGSAAVMSQPSSEE